MDQNRISISPRSSQAQRTFLSLRGDALVRFSASTARERARSPRQRERVPHPRGSRIGFGQAAIRGVRVGNRIRHPLGAPLRARTTWKNGWSPSGSRTPLTLFPGIELDTLREPMGLALIIAPWNYPFQLVHRAPRSPRLSAGNCAHRQTVRAGRLPPRRSSRRAHPRSTSRARSLRRRPAESATAHERS